MRFFSDTYVMFKRNIKIGFRNPDAFGMAIVAPFIMIMLFGLVLGGAMEMGRANYVNFIVPSIMMISIVQSTIFVGISINREKKAGIVDRFRSMPIAQSSFLLGHVCASVFRSVIVVVAVTVGAFIIGFRPEASFTQWLAIAGIFLLVTVAATWLAVFVGLVVKSEESASSSLTMISLLPYLSSGFAPIETLPRWLALFAEHQPFTPVIDSARALMMGSPVSNSDLILSVVWWTGIAVVACIAAVKMYGHKLAK
ncbi:MAG: ABC transporter permease [Coriobacteriia bacterium]|nr:ABC transporter permease [Coriobacteriia bacterium]MCL2746370.1 ABC transporter permease [Coriobacteriia bacterium]MCL2870802.1 ABC transporter permease [Coriobacteriia bacterium]